MNHLESRSVRSIIAVVVGLPGTMTLGLFALFVAGSGTAGILLSAFELFEARLRTDYVASQLGWALVALVWGIAGVGGIVGFWMWVFSSRPLSMLRRRTIAALLTGGVAAIIPVIGESPDTWLHWLSVAGCIVGALLVIEMCFLTTRSSGP